MSIEVEGNSINSANYLVTKLNEPSAPISGTYKLFFNGTALQVNVNGAWTENIPYDAPAW